MAAIETLNQVYHTLQTKGVRLTNQWKMTFHGIPGGLDSVLGDATYIYVDSAMLPGRNTDVAEFMYQAFPFSIPTRSTQTNEISFTFRGDRNLEYRQAFIAWQDIHSNLDFSASGGATTGGLKMFTDATIHMDLLDETLTAVADKYQLVGCFPIRVGDITLSQSDSSIVTYEVAFRYQYWSNNGSNNINVNVSVSI